jgi:hypothetical protein
VGPDATAAVTDGENTGPDVLPGMVEGDCTIVLVDAPFEDCGAAAKGLAGGGGMDTRISGDLEASAGGMSSVSLGGGP